MENVLFVDDEYEVLSAFQRNLRKHYKVSIATSGKEGLELMTESRKIAVVVSDFNMPEMSGVEFLTLVKEASPETVRMLLTGFADLDTAMNAVNKGNIFRFMTKPISTNDIIPIIDAGIEQYNLIKSEKELLNNTLKGSIKVLIDILSTTNPTAFSKSTRIRNIAKGIALNLKIEKLWEVEIAALLSQIGCIAIPEFILEKVYNGESLTSEEKNLYDKHPNLGHELLKNIPRLEAVSEAIGKQNLDPGTYSSENVPGKEIPLLSKILRVANDFDTYLQKGDSEVLAFKKLLLNQEKYEAGLIRALEKDLTGLGTERMEVKAIPFRNIRVNMTLADNITDSKGVILLTKGNEITDVNLMRLITASRVRKINEPIKVWVKK